MPLPRLGYTELLPSLFPSLFSLAFYNEVSYVSSPVEKLMWQQSEGTLWIITSEETRPMNDCCPPVTKAVNLEADPLQSEPADETTAPVNAFVCLDRDLKTERPN